MSIATNTCDNVFSVFTHTPTSLLGNKLASLFPGTYSYIFPQQINIIKRLKANVSYSILIPPGFKY
jgi:hypothetical protein